MGFKIDKTHVLGGTALMVAVLSYSAYTGKLDISKFTGGGSNDAEVTFERRLPPPPKGADPVSAEDVVANLDTGGELDAFIAESSGAPETIPAEEVDLSKFVESTPPRSSESVPADDVLAALAAQKPSIEPAAQLASNNPAALIATSGAAVTSAPAIPAPRASAAPSVGSAPNSGPRVFGAPSNAPTMSGNTPITSPAAPAPVTDQAQSLAPAVPSAIAGNAGLPPPAAMAPPVLPSAPAASATASLSAPVPMTGVAVAPVHALAGRPAPMPVGTPIEASASAGASVYDPASAAAAAAAIASLPANATGKDLLALQTQLALLEKQKAIASGQEAIAESRLKTAKANYELAQIGQPTYEQRMAMAQMQAAQRAVTATPASAHPLSHVKLLSTTRANGSIAATLSVAGKLVDVKKGSVISGYLVDKLTDNSVSFIADGKTETVWIN